jgi:hypothetical protein
MFNKSVVTLSAILFSGSLFASCPPTGGPYRLIGHNANNTRCTYESVKDFRLDIRGNKLVKPHCPDPIMTDPAYQNIQCHHDAIKAKCICVAVHR